MSQSSEPVKPESDPMTIDPSNLGSVDPLSVEGLFLVALGKTGPARAAFLAVSCPDAEQRQRVEALLAAYENAGSFLEKPAVSPEPTPVGQYLAPCEVPGAIGKLGPYEILEEIGRGGMGVVFRAHDPKLQRIVAVKALAPELARLPAARQRFLREARAAAAISHPHVVTIFAVDGTEEASLGTERTTLPYLVMECIVGQTLHDKIKRVGALKTEEIVRISRQIAEGLTAAHKRGLIHRDIKPANILLENGVERVKITDFGLARTVSDGGITHTGEILGTPQCMSPEQARGEVVDQRSDLFSLGCVMYTMCTGVSPFRADNMLAVMKKVCESEPRPVAQLNPNVPEWLCALVHMLLQKEPERRVQTAGEVVEVLESRVIATGAHAATSPTKRRADESSQAAQGDIPKWLLTPVIPGLEQWLFKDSLLPVTLIAMLIGFFFGENKESRILMLPLAGILGFGLLSLAKVLLKTPWSWINWKTWITVPPAIFVGGVGRAWLIHRSRSGVGLMEELVRNNAGWFVFPLAIGVFWLLNRYFRDLFIQNPQSDSRTRSTPPQPLHWSTWIIIALTVLTGGMLAFGDSRYSSSLTEAVVVVYVMALNVWLFVHLAAWGVKLAKSRDNSPPVAFATAATAATTTLPPRSPWSVLGWILVGTIGLGMLATLGFAVALFVPYLAMKSVPMQHATYVIRTPEAENLKYVSINGEQALLHPGGPGEWRIATTPGTHSIYVSYSSDSALHQERFFTTNATVEQGRTTVIAAEPAMVRSLTRPPGLEFPTPRPTDKPVVDGGSMTSNPPPGMTIGANALPSPSIPLADAVEVLTDPATMPRHLYVVQPSSENVTQVWVDEPGLIVRLKPLDFEGKESSEEEYVASCAWGLGNFQSVDAPHASTANLPVGRYRVLVQDLDYGWELDRRGNIVIGRGTQTIHVKRSFVGQQLKPEHQSVNFRWAGKSYQFTMPEQIAKVNTMLASLAGEAPYSELGVQYKDYDFTVDPLGEQLALGTGALQHERRRMKLQFAEGAIPKSVSVSHSSGTMTWSRPVPEGFTVPEGALRFSVLYQPGFWWPGDDTHPLDLASLPDQTLVVGRLTKAIMREAITRTEDWSQVQGLNIYWFREHSTRIRSSAAPAAKRLIQAWLDGQPDVPETELLALGKAENWAVLWQYYAETNNLMTDIVEPGNEPGMWRMKEPPEGAVAP
ncbi:MAG: serine/threonine protein kinase [Planctomycetota bacterium]|nr:MAG: serine/threonine protein kinase [Planctomycetota bacterium]